MQWHHLQLAELMDRRGFAMLSGLLTCRIPVLAERRLSFVNSVWHPVHWATFDQIDHPQRQCMHSFVGLDSKMHQDSMSYLYQHHRRYSHHHRRCLGSRPMFDRDFLNHHPMLNLDPNFNNNNNNKKTRRKIAY